MKRFSRFLALATLTAASAFGQDAVVIRKGDGTVVVPTGGGDVVVTTRTVSPPSIGRIPRRGVKLDEKQLERFLRERAAAEAGWT
ncbi:MAG TPA: hypothetical protein VJU16_07510 [Planctomycetota bacterium]|nr:hypothetical protein [Planctomycetota bacterium]